MIHVIYISLILLTCGLSFTLGTIIGATATIESIKELQAEEAKENTHEQFTGIQN